MLLGEMAGRCGLSGCPSFPLYYVDERAPLVYKPCNQRHNAGMGNSKKAGVSGLEESETQISTR